MTAPVGRRKPGRPTVLTEHAKQALFDAVKLGAPVELCAAAAGISETSFYRWMTEGRLEHESIEAGNPPNPEKADFLEVFTEVTAGRVQAATRNVAAIQKAVQGGAVIEESTRTFRDHAGELVTEKTVKRSAPDWRAASWYLERQFNRYFGKAAQEIQLTGAGGGPVQITTDAEDLSKRLSEHLAAANTMLAATVPAALNAAADHDVDDPADPGDEPVEAELVDGDE